MSDHEVRTEARRRLSSSARRLLFLIVAGAGAEMIEAALKILEADAKNWRKEEL